MKILKAEDLCFSYQNKYQTVEAVKNVTCDFAAGRGLQTGDERSAIHQKGRLIRRAENIRMGGKCRNTLLDEICRPAQFFIGERAVKGDDPRIRGAVCDRETGCFKCRKDAFHAHNEELFHRRMVRFDVVNAVIGGDVEFIRSGSDTEAAEFRHIFICAER